MHAVTLAVASPLKARAENYAPRVATNERDRERTTVEVNKGGYINNNKQAALITRFVTPRYAALPQTVNHTARRLLYAVENNGGSAALRFHRDRLTADRFYHRASSSIKRAFRARARRGDVLLLIGLSYRRAGYLFRTRFQTLRKRRSCPAHERTGDGRRSE